MVCPALVTVMVTTEGQKKHLVDVIEFSPVVGVAHFPRPVMGCLLARRASTESI